MALLDGSGFLTAEAKFDFEGPCVRQFDDRLTGLGQCLWLEVAFCDHPTSRGAKLMAIDDKGLLLKSCLGAKQSGIGAD